ncbi:MAG: GNAT family protein [Flavihumibacter sp.]
MKQTDVRLRPVTISDADELANLANNRKIFDNVRDMIPHPYAMHDAIWFIDACGKDDPPLNLAIETGGRFCGMIGVVPQKDVHRLGAEIGYWIGEPYWGRGIATQAVAAMIHYAFTQFPFVRLYAGIFEHNAASMRVLEKNGFVKEGIGRKAIIKNGLVIDEHRYALLKQDSPLIYTPSPRV